MPAPAKAAPRHAGHDAMERSAGSCGGAAGLGSDCCTSPGSPPVVPVDLATPPAPQQVQAPAPAPLAVLPVPVRTARSEAVSTVLPRSSGPPLYTLHSSLLN